MQWTDIIMMKIKMCCSCNKSNIVCHMVQDDLLIIKHCVLAHNYSQQMLLAVASKSLLTS